MSKNTQISELINYLSVDGSGNIVITGSLIGPAGATYATQSYVSTGYLALSGGTLTGALNGTSASFSGDITTTATGFQGRYTRIYEASAQRGGLYPYNIISGAGTDYSIGLFSESSLWFAAGGGVTKHFIIASTGAATFSNSITATIGYIGSNTTTGFGGVKLFVKSTSALDYEGLVVQSSSNSDSITIAHTGTIGRIASTYGTGGTGTFTDLALATGGIDRLTISASTGNATFSGALRVTGAVGSVNLFNLYKSDNTTLGGQLAYDSSINQLYLWNNISSGYFSIYVNNSEAFKIASNSAATFLSNVSATDYININGATHSYLNLNAANSGGNEAGIYFKIGGTAKWEQYTAANDGNLNFWNNGNGIRFIITASGGATFASTINTGGDVTIATGNIKLYTQQNIPGQYRYIGTEYSYGNGNNKAEIRFGIESDTFTNITFHTANGAGTLYEVLRMLPSGRVIMNNTGVSNNSGGRDFTIQGSLSTGGNDSARIALTQIWNGVSYPAIITAQTGSNVGVAAADMVFKTSYWNGSSVVTYERLRINDYGYVTIGQTTPSGNTNGIYFRPGIESGFIVTNDVALQLGRLGTTGDIQTFYTGSTRVGKISVGSSTVTFESASNGGVSVFDSGNVTVGSISGNVYKFNVSGSVRSNRVIYNWFNGAWQGNGTYYHMKTNLYGGGAGNLQYTMSYFKGYSYSYSAHILEGGIGFHNWSGALYNLRTTGNLFTTAYVSSDGYVVLVIPSGNGESGVTLDWHQHWDYPFISAIVTNAGLHGSTTGKY